MVKLEPKARDALFAHVTDDLDVFGDFERALHESDQDGCDSLGQKLRDALVLLVDGNLGWQTTTTEPTVLSLPDAELRRIVDRIRADLGRAMGSVRPGDEEGQVAWDEMATVRAACGVVLEQTRA